MKILKLLILKQVIFLLLILGWICINTLLYVNPNTFIGFCARRYHTIYCDKHFLDDEKGQMLVRKVFEPMANLKDGKGIIFV